jgi:3-oxoacyl-[acyl-carrier protein] reductase
MSAKTAVIFGYGAAVGDAILEGFVRSGYQVAIVARTQAKLDSVAADYQSKGDRVFAFVADLSKPEEVVQVIQRIVSELGHIHVGIYNATQGIVPYDAAPEQFESAANVNITSMHSAFGALLPAWREAHSGRFLLTGGVFGNNGAWSVGFNFQFGAAAKAYFRNFAESASTTFNGDGISVVNMCVASMVYGGDNLKLEDPNPEASRAFRMKIGQEYVRAAENAKEEWVPQIVLSP